MAQESQSIESIFDFFYLDNPKIKSFYAQLNGLGALNALKNTSQIGDIRKMEATVGLPTVTGGKLGNDHSVSSTAEHLYDAIPTMPREMIDRLDELGFIHRELNESMLGNLILCEGRLGVLDVGVAKELLEPALNRHIKELERFKETKKEAQEIRSSMRDLTTFYKNIPFGLEAKLLVDTGAKDVETGIPLCDELWMTLNREEITGSPYDINFKHGPFLSGKWYVLGVLDALPHDNFTYTTVPNELKDGISDLVKVMQQMAGRPDSAFGITPIAIFRVLKPK
ncbi:hypothetical protein NDN13_05160 [Acinetobacter sp. C32I]|uniref:DUF6414 family protein n=1 Tax=Acinetobacter sp. C32I TaxID=2950074 RepID=UPI002036F489|nr:hypothetical protein [Acinetobacter sp. C32I]USA54586.1 hypothetical protein NDN13_05160 [Acinetobacter sp. C32I]